MSQLSTSQYYWVYMGASDKFVIPTFHNEF